MSTGHVYFSENHNLLSEFFMFALGMSILCPMLFYDQLDSEDDVQLLRNRFPDPLSDML